MPAPTDRAALEKAIGDGRRITSPGTWYYTPDCFEYHRVVLAAAQAHLDALPVAGTKTRCILQALRRWREMAFVARSYR